MSSEHQPPKTKAEDVVYAVVRAGVGSVPIVGAAASELLGLLAAPPLERRRDEWMKNVGEALRRLESERGIQLEDLRENPAFIDAVVATLQAAMRTSEVAKLEALRNAVLNSALPTAPPLMEQQLFLTLADRLTALHLAVLGLFREPLAWRSPDGRRLEHRRSSVPRTVLEEAFPVLGGSNRALADLIWKDLLANDLVRNASLDNAGEGDGVMKKRLTELGDRFVRFISDPLS